LGFSVPGCSIISVVRILVIFKFKIAAYQVCRRGSIGINQYLENKKPATCGADTPALFAHLGTTAMSELSVLEARLGYKRFRFNLLFYPNKWSKQTGPLRASSPMLAAHIECKQYRIRAQPAIF
jgi:hypothetical protein